MYKLVRSNTSSFFSIAVLSLLVLFCFSCKVTPKNDCEISDEDAKLFLGNVKLFTSDKSKLPIEEGKNSPNIRGCIFATDEQLDIPSLRWTNIEFHNEQQSQENFARVKETTGKDYSKIEISGIGNEAYLTQGEETGKKISLTVRKGRNVFLVIAILEHPSEKSIENVKTLAKKIANKTSD